MEGWTCGIFLSVFAFFVIETCGSKLPEVTLAQGRLQGTLLKTTKGKTFEGFLGVPYAKPPVGELRFKVAQPPKPWKGRYNASVYGPGCLQYMHMGYEFMGSEDCLFINVFRPEGSSGRSELLDVIVHIHGGAFMFLDGASFGPEYIMKEDIVYVNFNYRLGPLGFMSTGDRALPGNLGLKDQVAALRWVRDNIRQFGGNPESVTITGLSAGGVSVHYQYLSPLSKGLFHRGVSASGAVLNPWALAESVPQKTRKVAASLGCPTKSSEDLVECLNTRPAELIVRQVPQFMGFYYSPYTPFGPVVEPEGTDQPFLPKNPYDIIKEGKTAKVPWLASFTTEEGLYPAAEFVEETEFLQKLDSDWTNLAPHLLDYNFTVKAENKQSVADNIRNAYFKGKSIPAGVKELIELVGDRLFGAGIVQSVLMQAATSPKDRAPVYLYRFGYRGKNSASQAFTHNSNNHGVAHGDDCLYITRAAFMNAQESDRDLEVQNHLINMWISFAKKGVPEFPMGSPLPVVQDGLPKLKYLELKSVSDANVKTTDELARMKYWSTLALKEKLHLPKSFRAQDEL